MTKAALEAAETDDTAVRVDTATPPPVLAVPASLHASLMARLDRLGSAKAIAQVGAVIGREFSHALVAAVVQKSQRELETELEQLIAAGLLFRQGVLTPCHVPFQACPCSGCGVWDSPARLSEAAPWTNCRCSGKRVF